MKIGKSKGSVTVEASIVLPIFISVVLTISFIIKLVYIHEVIQHAIGDTGKQMASYSYFYHISGIQEIQDTARSGLKSKAQLFQEHADTIIDSYEYLQEVPSKIVENADATVDEYDKDDLNQAKNAYSNNSDTIKETKENLDNTVNVLKEVSQNPMDEVKSLVCVLAEGGFEDIKTEVCVPFVRGYIKKYLRTDDKTSIENSMKKFNIINGFNGLDFSESCFFEDENNNIDIIVKYKVEIPVPFKVFPSLTLVQRSTVKAWLGGDEKEKPEGDKSTESDDVWALNNFQRGDKIRTVFGANLPKSFPIISSFDSATGKAIMIKSIDLTAKSYQSGDELIKTIDDYTKKLIKFDGQEEPWGKKGITINKSEIKTREMILVIPKNPVKPEIKLLLDDHIKIAASKGITVKVEEYGTKKVTQATN